VANWNGKRFVPFTDEILWKSNGEGVYDNKLRQKVVSFKYFTGAYELKAAIATRLNETVPVDDCLPQVELGYKIYHELKITP
jgi:hypothetical protein